MSKSLLLLFFVLLSSSSMSALAQVVVAVDSQLDKYWVSEKQVAPKYPRMALRRGKMGCVAVVYTIQADGQTHDHKVLAFYPSDIFDKSAIKALKQFEYSPSVQNPDKTPVQTLNVFTYHVTDDTVSNEESGEDTRELLYEMCSKAGKKTLGVNDDIGNGD